jgi:squalene/oxidosqualene cyclase-like protein
MREVHRPQPTSSSPDVTAAVQRAVAQLATAQAPSGSWPADYGGPMFLLPMWVALAWAANRLPPPARVERLLLYFRSVQRADGSIGLHAESTSGSMFTTALSYVSMRLLGVAPDDAGLTRMRGWIHANGSPLGAASWGKFTLCLLGLYEWAGLHPLPPELWLLPKEAPLHPSKLWCHARQVYLPMAWLYGVKATVPLTPLLQALRDELYDGRWTSIDWKAQRDTVAVADDYRPSTTAMAAANQAQRVIEALPKVLFRQRALDECLHHIRYEDSVTGDLDIGPVNAVLNMFVHHFRGAAGRADFERGWPKFDNAYLWDGHDGLKMQGYNSSELWDLAFTLQAVHAAATSGAVDEAAAEPVLRKAYAFLRDNQILEDVPEPERHYRHRSKGGWPFSTRAHGWPITDCTAEGLICALLLEGRFPDEVPTDLLRAAVSLILSWQNDDGGWATYERQRAGAWLEALNPSQVFGDIMVDYSYVECTGACLRALLKAKARFPGEFELDQPIARGLDFIRRAQRVDGSFEGSWAVCFTYGTWFGVSALRAAGVAASDPAVQRAVAFLLGKQRLDGSWSEAGDTCRERRWLEGTDGQVAQTAWALMALVRANCTDEGAMERAAAFLISRQAADGSWPREPLVGVFNRTCLINYDNYRNLFPLWALAEFRAR